MQMMNNYDFEQDLKDIQTRINQFLEAQLNQVDTQPAPLADAMKYALLLGGKRIRPFLVYATGPITLLLYMSSKILLISSF